MRRSQDGWWGEYSKVVAECLRWSWWKRQRMWHVSIIRAGSHREVSRVLMGARARRVARRELSAYKISSNNMMVHRSWLTVASLTSTVGERLYLHTR